MRITSHVNNLRVLRNCTVIEGHLAIILIENAEPGDFDAVSFPHLREVGNYLLLYRLYGLRSVDRLFPNLAVIRGQVLFFNYALVCTTHRTLLGWISEYAVRRAYTYTTPDSAVSYLNHSQIA